MNGMGPRGPLNEGMQKFAPILMLIVFGLVLAALVINFVQGRLHPESQSERFDVAQNFPNINSRGMLQVLMRKPANRSQAEEAGPKDR